MLTRRNRGGFDETDETFAIAIDSCVDEVADGDFWASVWEASVDITLLVLGWSCGSWKGSQNHSPKENRGDSGLHDGGNDKERLRLTRSFEADQQRKT